MGPIVVAAVAAVALVGVALFAGSSWLVRCDRAGDGCCRADGEVKTDHCHAGLGCDITTRTCAPCGAPGQPCCDGHLTGFSLKGYTGIVLDSPERIESCDAGAACDARLAEDGTTWEGTRRCGGCGTTMGGPCCPPDVRYALGRCFTDAVSKQALACSDPWAGADGVCVACGRQVGELACPTGFPCADGMVEENGLCVHCGVTGAPTCDRGEPCRDGGSVPAPLSHHRCVLAGGPNQPCLPGARCGYEGLFCNAKKICEPCGNGGERCCPAPVPACRVGECVDGRCFACGYENMPVCPGSDPCPHAGEPLQGRCVPCGRAGQRCCYGLSIRCFDGMRCEDGTCRTPPPPPRPAEEWKTCSGQPYALWTVARPVTIEDANGCIVTVAFIASSQEEAIMCARAQYGDAVVDGPLEQVSLSVTCSHSGCMDRTYYGRDEDAAKSCAEASSPGCTVDDTPCP